MGRPQALALLGAVLALSGVGGPRTTAAPRLSDDAARRVVLDPARLAPDLVALRREGVLRVAVPAGASSFAIVGGRVIGFDYEVLDGLARSLDVRLELTVLDDEEARYAALAEGRVHVVAGRVRSGPPRPGIRGPTRLAAGRHLAFRSDSPGLAVWTEAWLSRESVRLAQLRRRYLAPGAVARLQTARQAGRLSPFDDTLREAEGHTGVDWRLLAALAFQESGWRRWARSPAGAVGLMQLMPATARQVDVQDRTDPSQSIHGGARYLAWLDGLWRERVPDPEARLPLVLASYNAGAGHVADARRLAAAAGEDVDDWSVVSRWLLALEEPRWASHPLVRHGRCSGSEPVHYVAAVLSRFGHYSALVPEEGVSSSGEPGPLSSSPASEDTPGGRAG